MRKSSLKVSIIIVNYKVEKELLACIDSIIKSQSSISYEIIVVDNSEKKIIEKKIKEKFPNVRYFSNAKNNGYGGGNNLGARNANGNYLLFLNPDTIVLSGAIDCLLKFIEKKNSVGLVAPLLLNADRYAYQQGSRDLNFITGFVTLSFINKLFPLNPISKNYFLMNWNRNTIKEVDVVPGTCFLIQKKIFNKIGGFDEKFFLYFEEFDLCRRVKKIGYKIFINPESKVIHFREASTKKRGDMKKIFSDSRFYYFKKHFGLLPALTINIICAISKTHIILGLTLVLGAFLRLYNLSELMTFIGDQGWFYLSARDMLLAGKIPLVGIASSHLWLHQGPLWTYVLAVVLWFFNFNPLGPGYLAVLIDTVVILLIYSIGLTLFSNKTGIIASFLYATSPLMIVLARMPYHTSFIPLLTLLFIYSIFKWVNGKVGYFPLAIFFLAVLYNLELATTVLSFMLATILFFGLYRRRPWVNNLLTKKNIFLSLLLFIIPMLPVIIYDISHNFSQTGKFLLWIGYKILVFFGYPSLHPDVQPESIVSITNFFVLNLQHLIYFDSSVFAVGIFIISFTYLLIEICKSFLRKRASVNFIILFLWITISTLGILVTRTKSQAYLPILFPGIIILIGVFLGNLFQNFKLRILSIILIIFIGSLNSIIILGSFTREDSSIVGMTLKKRIEIAHNIVRQANGQKYNLIAKDLSFSGSALNYEYLTWWLGNSPSKENEQLNFILNEKFYKIELEKESLNNSTK